MLGKSDTHGFGVFAAERAGTRDVVVAYVGELVPHAEAHARGQVYDAVEVSYFYTLARDLVLDATRVGSRMRYVNHIRARANLVPKRLSVCGYVQVGLFASREVVPREEHFFDFGYDVTGRQK